MALPAPRFANLDDFKIVAGFSGTAQDAAYRAALAAAEDFVERYTRRRFAPEPALNSKGEDVEPTVRKRFTTRGRLVCRIPDLRILDESPGKGVVFYGRSLLNNQYFLGVNAYGGPEGSGSQAEPATEITLGYGYGTGYGIAEQFQFVVPLGYKPNDLEIWGRWGWNPVPPSVLDAVYGIAARRIREKDASWSDTVVTPEGGALTYFRQLPASIQAEIDRLRHPNISFV